jgi:hypothetical protein
MREHTHRIGSLLWFLIFALSLWGFYQASLAYQAFPIDQGVGVNRVPPNELTFSLWYLVYGAVGALSLTRALSASSLPGHVEAALRRLATRHLALVGGVSLCALAAILLFRHFVLQHAPIADDESTYVFIARTLLHGRVINPLPGDNEFFDNQWLVFNAEGWYGKYPIGHPLLLAIGEAVGARMLVVPLISFGSLLMTYVIGRRIFGEHEALLALGLLALSPQFLMTSATELSQPSAALFMLLGLWATLQVMDRERWPWALAAGAAWAYGVLVRPLPGVLFLIAAAAVFILSRGDRSWGPHLRKRLPLALVALVPMAACAALMLWINHRQTGGALQSGYEVTHGKYGFFANKDGQISLSVAAALLRQNLWLFGWPLSFLFVPFARSAHRPAFTLVWALIGAEYFYRVLVPKTVVATTGPIYVMEIVPLLALLTGGGVVGAKRWLAAHHVRGAKTWVVSVVLASTAVAYLMFVPVRTRGIQLNARTWNEVYRALQRRDAPRKALVFSLYMVNPDKKVSWAYYPPPPSPALDDDILFVRIPATGDRLQRVIEFWQRRFPEYTAWYFNPREGLKRIPSTPPASRSAPRQSRPRKPPSRRLPLRERRRPRSATP